MFLDGSVPVRTPVPIVPGNPGSFVVYRYLGCSTDQFDPGSDVAERDTVIVVILSKDDVAVLLNSRVAIIF